MALLLYLPATALALAAIGLFDEAVRLPFHVGGWSGFWGLCCFAGAVALATIATGRLA